MAPTRKERQSSPRSSHSERHGPILVPIDFSQCSAHALAYAARLADYMNASMTVLHVVHDPGDAPGYYNVEGKHAHLTRLEDRAHELLDDFMDEVIEQNPGNTVLARAEKILVTGLPVSRILEVAEKLQPEMLVMGSVGRTHLSAFLLGSKAEQVVRLSPYPVTIVKLPKDEFRE
ncbi:MAG: universal stress protein [Proteobacteria bacterium]|nr:universal stress protein [Pseudomonadota bacterium]